MKAKPLLDGRNIFLLLALLSCVSFAFGQGAPDPNVLAAELQKKGERPALIFEAPGHDCTYCRPFSYEIYEAGLIVEYSDKTIQVCVSKATADRAINEARNSMTNGSLKEPCSTWIVSSTLGLAPWVRVSLRNGDAFRTCKVIAGAVPDVLRNVTQTCRTQR